MIKILFVCHGNICRSTMAESVFVHLAAQRGLSQDFEVDSAGVSAEEEGNGVHIGTRRKLAEKGVPVVPHSARQIKRRDLEYFDYVIAMDESNMRRLRRMADGMCCRIALLLSYLPAHPREEVADPWYTGDFEETYADVAAGCEALLESLI